MLSQSGCCHNRPSIIGEIFAKVFGEGTSDPGQRHGVVKTYLDEGSAFFEGTVGMFVCMYETSRLQYPYNKL